MTAPSTDTPPRPRRTQHERSSAARAALLDAAVRCVCRSGLPAVTLTDIANEAGFTKGAIQHHFQDKQALVLAMADMGYRHLLRQLEDVGDAVGPLHTRVSVVIDVTYDAYSADSAKAAWEVLLSSRSDPALALLNNPVFAEASSDIDQKWLELFGDTCSDDDRVAGCRQLVRATIQGLIVREYAGSPEASDRTLTLLKEAVTTILSAA